MHHIFYESYLTNLIGPGIQSLTELPPINSKGNLVWVPEKVLNACKKQLRNQIIYEVGVKWEELPREEATWKRPNICTKRRDVERTSKEALTGMLENFKKQRMELNKLGSKDSQSNQTSNYEEEEEEDQEDSSTTMDVPICLGTNNLERANL